MLETVEADTLRTKIQSLETMTPAELQVEIDSLEKKLEVARLRQTLLGAPSQVSEAAQEPTVPMASAPAPMPDPSPVPDMLQAAATPATEMLQGNEIFTPATEMLQGNEIFDSAAQALVAPSAIVPPSAVDAGFTAADLVNLGPVFLAAFTIFPAAVII